MEKKSSGWREQVLARERGDDGRWVYVHKTAGSREHMKGRMEGERVALFSMYIRSSERGKR